MLFYLLHSQVDMERAKNDEEHLLICVFAANPKSSDFRTAKRQGELIILDRAVDLVKRPR